MLRPVACVLKMFPRFSETFVLDEKDVALARAPDTYVPELTAGYARVERDFDLSRSVGRLRALLDQAVVA